jgi:biotin carboxyl carrier protein
VKVARLEVESEVQGTVWKHLVSVGDSVAAGDVLLIIESMKMEIPVAAPAAGRVLELPAACEAPVEEEQVVAVLESNDQADSVGR